MPHSPPQNELCSACHKRPSTCHTTVIIGGVAQVNDLCNACFESVGPAAAREVAAAMRDARCRFCGGPAIVGGMDHLALSLGEQRMEHECLACSQEFSRYTMRILKRMPDGLSRQEQTDAIRQLREDATRHMQQWISKRQSQ